MGAVKPFKMPDSSFLKQVRKLAADSNKVVITDHAAKRMRQRKVSLPQVLACLLRGTISEPVHQDMHGNWKATLAHRHAGEDIRVAVAITELEDGSKAVVITVMT